jgi:hypothetical protein
LVYFQLTFTYRPTALFLYTFFVILSAIRYELTLHFDAGLRIIFLAWFHVKHIVACGQATGKPKRQPTLPVQTNIQSV